MKNRYIPRDLAERGTSAIVLKHQSGSRLPRHDAAPSFEWPLCGIPEDIIADNSRDLIGSISIATPDGGWRVLLPPAA